MVWPDIETIADFAVPINTNNHFTIYFKHSMLFANSTINDQLRQKNDMTNSTSISASAVAEPYSRQAFQILRFGFTVAPIIAGLDKFLHLLGNWDVVLLFHGGRYCWRSRTSIDARSRRDRNRGRNWRGAKLRILLDVVAARCSDSFRFVLIPVTSTLRCVI